MQDTTAIPFGGASANYSGAPSLLEYLWGEYSKYLEGQLAERKSRGEPVGTLNNALHRAPAMHFVTWAGEHLQTFPAIENYMTEGAVGVRLANGAHVTISPNSDAPGSMQATVTVPVLKPRD